MNKVKLIVSAVLFVLITGACIFGIVKLTSIETKTVSPFKFSVGALDEETGAYVDNEAAIVTKDPIECQGLTVIPKFDSTVDYKIFWYNENETYISCTELFSMYDKFESEIPRLVKYCRIVIYPSQFDAEGKPIDNFNVKFYEAFSYASNLKIKVNKVQDFKLVDLRDVDAEYITYSKTELDSSYTIIQNANFATANVTVGATFEDVLNVGTQYSTATQVTKLDCSDVAQYKFVFSGKPAKSTCQIYQFKDNKIYSIADISISEGSEYTFNVTSTVDYMVVVTPCTLGNSSKSLDYSIYETLLR